MEECDKIMVKIREDRHQKTLERQKAKLDRLMYREEHVNRGGCSNKQRYVYHNSGKSHQSSTDNSYSTYSIPENGSTPENGTTSEDPPTSNLTTVGDSNSKWVINMSKKPLTEPQMKLLAHGPNYAVTPNSPPIGEYIAAVEKTCQSLTQGKADEMRAEIKAAIKRSHPLDPTSLGKSKEH